jgi:protein-disulfide isomerase
VVGIFLATGMSRAASVGQLPGRLSSDLRQLFARPAALLATLLVLAGSASLIAFFPKEGGEPRQAVAAAPGGTDADNFTRAWNQQPRRDLGVPAEGAQVVIVKFVDWQCPSCKAAYFAYKPILEKYAQSHPGLVREVVKDYPLSNRCNPLVGSEVHIAACEEAVAVRAARLAGKAEEMITWMFTAPGQQEITPDQVKAKTREILGNPSFDFDKAYAEHLPAIQRDVADAGALSVRFTPTYYVNGVLAQTETGWLPPGYFDLAIKIELEKAGSR